MIPLSCMRCILDVSERDLGQYYRSTYVIVQKNGLYDVLCVEDVDDERLHLSDDEWYCSSECYVMTPKAGFYGGVFICTRAERHYKKGMNLCLTSARAFKRYINTGAGFSEFNQSGDALHYRNEPCAVQVDHEGEKKFLFTNQHIAEKYMQEFKQEALYDI